MKKKFILIGTFYLLFFTVLSCFLTKKASATTLKMQIVLEDEKDGIFQKFRNDILKTYEQNSQNKPLASDEIRSGYDSGKSMNVYTFPNKRKFYSNVLSEMTTTHDVLFDFDEGVEYFCYKDDEEFVISPKNPIVEHGSYRVLVYSPHTTDASSDFKDYLTVFSFRLVKHRINNLNIITAPLSAEIINVYSNNKKLLLDNAKSFRIVEEGVYRVEIRDLKTNIVYMDTFVFDNSNPHLDILGLNRDNVSSGGFVTVKNNEKDVKVLVLRNGENVFEVLGQSEHIYSDYGSYSVLAIDEAGNTSEYKFKIIHSVKGGGQIFLGLFVVLFLIIVGNIIYLKKKFVIR